VYWSPDATYQILLNSFGVWPLHFSPEDFKNRMRIAKKLQNENTRPINSVDLAYMHIFYMTSWWGRKKQEILQTILGQYQDYFLKLIALSFFKIKLLGNVCISTFIKRKRVYKAGNILKILGFFSFSSWALFWLKFSGKINTWICWTYLILQILNQRFGVNVQTPTHESTKQKIS
jgi:hypothetical protein